MKENIEASKCMYILTNLSHAFHTTGMLNDEVCERRSVCTSSERERVSLTQREIPTVLQDWQHQISSWSQHTAQTESWKAACAVPLNQPMFAEASGLQLSNSLGTISFYTTFWESLGKGGDLEECFLKTLINQNWELSPLATHLSFHRPNAFLMKSII